MWPNHDIFGQKTGKGSCDPNVSEQVDLSGEFNAVVFTDKQLSEGKHLRFQIEGNSFKLVSDGTTIGQGMIAAVNTCGYTSIALRFESIAQELSTKSEFMRSAISLEARPVRSLTMKSTTKSQFGHLSNGAIILATTRQNNGALAGADLAILICPEYPDCLKYPKCSCPSP